MSNPPSTARKHFHEGPLVVFSGLATAGAGIGAAHLLRGLLGGGWVLPSAHAVLLVGFLALGGVVSSAHLGRPSRGPLALLGLGRSPLSNEIAALGVTLLLGASALLLPGGFIGGVAGFLTSVVAVLFLLSLGGVYILPGQVAWRGFSAASPLILGLGWGMLLEMNLRHGPVSGPWVLFLWGALILDAGIAVARWRSLETALFSAGIVHPRLFARRRILLAARLGTGSLATFVAVFLAAWLPAIVFFSLALGLDRLGFYALALRRTTESEVRRVEALLQG